MLSKLAFAVAMISLVLFSRSPQAFGAPGASLPVWQGMDLPDRRYESDVVCKFTPTITKDAGRTVLYPQADASGTIVGTPLKFEGYQSLREALGQSCNVCLSDLEVARNRLIKKRDSRFIEERCYLRNCTTKSGRKVAVDEFLFNSVFGDDQGNLEKNNYCHLLRPQYHQVDPANTEVYNFFDTYSRPNDDTFQNLAGKGGYGEPFEVAIVYNGLRATRNLEKGGFDLELSWRAEMTTGRHVEAGVHFVLRESRSSMEGESQIIKPGLRKVERLTNVAVQYPAGVNADSSTQSKIGSVIFADLPIGTIVGDGDFSGDAEVRTKKSVGAEGDGAKDTRGITQLGGIEGPKEGVYKRLTWGISVRKGRITNVSLSIMRFNILQPLKLVFSNYRKVDRSTSEHQHYVAQTPLAPCKKETVGEGDLVENETKAEKLGKQVGAMIEKSGCLDCHGEGSADLFRFCDNGVSVRPKDDAPKIMSMITNGVPVKPDGRTYPKGMINAMKNLKELDAQQNLIQQWLTVN